MNHKFALLGFFIVILNGALQTGHGRLLITELFYDTPGDDAREEWIELANVGTDAVDLSNLIISDEEQPGGREGALQFPKGTIIAPGQVTIVAQTAVAFRNLYGFNPDFEMQPSDPDVPTMRRYEAWATGDFGLANGGDELLLLTAQHQILDAINYGESTHFFTPGINDVLRGQSIIRLPADCDSDTAADWQPQPAPTPGQISFDGVCMAVLPPSAPDTPLTVGAIQGETDVSPRLNEQVTFRGIVTGFFEDINSEGVIFHTMFVQDIPGQEDGNPATSDGLAIFLGRERPSAQIGDHLLISGQVTEFFGFTEIDDNGLKFTVEAEGQPLPVPVVVDPPGDNKAQQLYFEALEGMRVTFAGEVTAVGPTFSGCGFAVAADLALQPPLVRQRAADPMGQIVPVYHTSEIDCADFPILKTGDRISGLAGPLMYHFDQFKMVNQSLAGVEVTAEAAPPLNQTPILSEHQISIATFNLENHFDSVNDSGNPAEPTPTQDEIRLKQIKLAAQISEVLGCPTLIGIQEVENETLLLDLATAVADQCGFTYTVTHRQSPDARGIDVALMSHPERVLVHHTELAQICTALATGIFDETINCPAGQQPLFSRPPLQVTLEIDREPFVVLINHFKSKRGGEEETAPRRLAQAQHIQTMVDTLLVVDAEAKIIVMGDFNDYELSAPLLKMTENGRLYNTLSAIAREARYSFNFGGAAQLLDGILVSPALVSKVASVTIHHVNADFPDAAADNPAAIYRATDHDLPLLILNGVNPGLKPDSTPTSKPPKAVPATPTVISSQPTAVAEPQTTGRGHWLIVLVGIGIGGGTAVYFFRSSRNRQTNQR